MPDGPTIEMTAPSGGDPALPGSVVTIEWTAMDDVGVTGVDLSYTADGVDETVIATEIATEEAMNAEIMAAEAIETDPRVIAMTEVAAVVAEQ